jgi:hypothetical protein
MQNGGGILFAMRLLILAAAIALGIHTQAAGTQGSAEPGDPFRIAILVDNSQTVLDPLPFVRRGLQQFLNALPPNHELMLVTTGGQMNIRVQPTRDYLEVMQSANAINVMRSSGNALFGSVEEIYARYLRGVERRYLMIVIIASDGPDLSQRITNENANALLAGLKTSRVLVNAALLTPTGWTGVTGSSQVRTLTLEMIERSGGALESASPPTLPGRLKTLAGRISQQYKQLSPTKAPALEFRR